MGNLNQRVGARLRCVREEAGFTARQFAELLGISESHYRRIENGHHVLMPEKIVILHTYLNIDPLFLLTGERRSENNIYAGTGRLRDRRALVMEELMGYCDNQEEVERKEE